MLTHIPLKNKGEYAFRYQKKDFQKNTESPFLITTITLLVW